MGARRHDVAPGAARGVSIALAALCLLALPAGAATTKKSSVPNRYGAIAYDQASRAWGVSQDQARERDAAIQALNQCAQKRCVVVHKFKNGCAALADSAKKFGVASGATRDEAETKAMQRCGAACQPASWACTR